MRSFLLSLLTLFCSISLSAQTVPNDSFEHWDIYPYDDPSSYWITSNFIHVPEYHTATVSKVAGYMSDSALRMEVKLVNGDTLTPFITNTLESITDTSGGQPYNGAKPTAITGFYRGNLLQTDTAFMFVMLKKNGAALSQDMFVIGRGVHPAFTPFSFPLHVPVVPDSVIILVMINDQLMEQKPGIPGSLLEIDSLSFITNSGNMLVKQGNFEDWTGKSYEVPIDWINDNEVTGGVFRSTDSRTGMYAAGIVTLEDIFFHLPSPASINTVFPIMPKANDTLDSLIFYYKYKTDAPGQDVGFMTAAFLRADSSMTGMAGIVSLDTTSTYKRVALSLDNRPMQPSPFLRLSFSSSNGMANALNSTLLIDDISILRTPVVSVKRMDKPQVRIYPNPVQNVLHVTEANGYEYKIADLTGRLVQKGTISEGAIHTAQLAKGIYLLTIADKDGVQYVKQFEKQ